jgi:hypothetical protein
MTPTQRETELQNLINKTVKKVYQRIDAALFKCAGLINEFGNNVLDNKAANKRFTSVFSDLNSQIDDDLKSYVTESWDLANEHYDVDTKEYLLGKVVTQALEDKYLNHNLSVLKEQLTKTIDGLSLSKRVWNLTDETRVAIESLINSNLSEALFTGRSASSIATTLKQYLKEPDRLFRRVRNSKGNLVPSKPMAAYHPGQGVYRSSYKNALRLAADQVNQSYRMAEHYRVQDLDFVTGVEICTSSNHPKPDICDHMKGIYPKSFIFRGWHTLCRCYKKTILLPAEDFDRYLQNDVPIDKMAKPVTNIPAQAKQYINDNKAMFERWKNKPYFLTDNKKLIKAS